MDVNRKIRIDGDYLQSYQDDYMEIQVDKMNQRVTFFSIVFIILMGISLTFGFFYIRNNVTKVPKEVQALSHQVVQRLSTISDRHAKMESSFQSKLSLLEKVTEALRKDQKEIQDAIDKINRTKADQNDVGRILGKSSQENFQAIEEVRSHLNTLSKSFTDQFNQFSLQFKTFNQDINDIVQTSIEKIQKDVQKKIDKMSGRFQEINSEMNAFATNVKTLDSNILTLKTEIDSFRTDIDSSKKEVDSFKSATSSFNKRISDVSETVNDLSTDLTRLSRSYKDVIDSDQLEELLSIERKNIQNNADLQKALLENHMKVLEEKLDNLKQQVEHIQKNSVQSRYINPEINANPVVRNQLPVKTRNKELKQKTSNQNYVNPVITKPPPDRMIEEDLP
jgi:chromosome segregation ATPase